MTTRNTSSSAVGDIVSDNPNRNLFPKLVLCTSNSASYFLENTSRNSDYDIIHRYLVDRFRPAFAQLTQDLLELGYDVTAEFHVDALIDQDYELSVGTNDDERVEAAVSKFHAAAQAILASLPDALGDLVG